MRQLNIQQAKCGCALTGVFIFFTIVFQLTDQERLADHQERLGTIRKDWLTTGKDQRRPGKTGVIGE